ncbi:protein clt2 [Anaeramoeba flamelloides]|uniref:Protein clt2 n=1 Tax=Anaeramoeba flamelloides TaxID=1746091 RepID=A0AAV7ZMU0_9EUKA|nr:protein clt2 [Anaeramoeba flamelloides]
MDNKTTLEIANQTINCENKPNCEEYTPLNLKSNKNPDQGEDANQNDQEFNNKLDLDSSNKESLSETIPKETPNEKVNNKLFKLTIVISLFFVSCTIYSLLLKKVAIAAPIYPFSLTQLSPLMGLIVYSLITVALYVGKKIKKEELAFPKYKAFIIGLLFCLVNLFQNLGNRGNLVPGPYVMIINNFVVIFSFLFEKLPPLRKKHTRYQYFSVVLLIIGIVTSVLSKLIAARGFSMKKSLLYVLLIVCANIFLSLSFIFIEWQLKTKHPKLAVQYLWSWVCFFQFLIGIPFSLLNAKIQGLDHSKIWSNFEQGVRCFVTGTNSNQSINCHSASVSWWFCICFGMIYNLAMGVSTRLGSATLVWLVKTMILPTATILFSFKWVMGENATQFHGLVILGFFLVLLSLLIYRGDNTVEFFKLKYSKKMNGFMKIPQNPNLSDLESFSEDTDSDIIEI